MYSIRAMKLQNIDSLIRILSLIRGIDSIRSRQIKIYERNDRADIICGLSIEGQKILKNFCPVIVTVCY